MATIGDPRKAGEDGPAGDQRKAGESGTAGDPRPAGEATTKAADKSVTEGDAAESKPKRSRKSSS